VTERSEPRAAALGARFGDSRRVDSKIHRVASCARHSCERASTTTLVAKQRVLYPQNIGERIRESYITCRRKAVARMSRKQCVWLVRYGLTEFPLVESVGPFDSDIDPTEGIEHATCIAKRIAESGEDSPKIVYSSPFLRTAHTAHIICTQSGNIPVKLEEGLWEWLTPSLLVEPNGVKTEPRSASELATKFDTIDTSYQSVNPVVPDDSKNVPAGSPHFVETEDALLLRCQATIERLLDAIQGDNIAIVSHAPCDQAIALYLEGAPCVAESKLGPWPLGGITMFSRTISQDGTAGPWAIEMYGDTEHMPGKYKPGIKKWSLPCLAETPEQQ